MHDYIGYLKEVTVPILLNKLFRYIDTQISPLNSLLSFCIWCNNDLKIASGENRLYEKANLTTSFPENHLILMSTYENCGFRFGFQEGTGTCETEATDSERVESAESRRRGQGKHHHTEEGQCVSPITLKVVYRIDNKVKFRVSPPPSPSLLAHLYWCWYWFW